MRKGERKLRIDDGRPRVEVLVIDGVPFPVIVKWRHIVRIFDALGKPADAVSAHVVVFDVLCKTLVRIYAVDGDLLYKPHMLALIADCNGYLYELFLNSG